jgi:uncharacterized protein YwlG (UPF0340 family)
MRFFSHVEWDLTDNHLLLGDRQTEKGQTQTVSYRRSHRQAQSLTDRQNVQMQLPVISVHVRQQNGIDTEVQLSQTHLQHVRQHMTPILNGKPQLGAVAVPIPTDHVHGLAHRPWPW